MTTLAALCFLLPVAGEPTGVLTLFAEQPWYKKAKPSETTFEGTLERNPGTGRAGPSVRFNAFRLAWIDAAGKPGGRELYLPEKAHLLAEYLGQRLRIIGKAVDVEADGKTYLEIWPARVELSDAPKTAPPPPMARDGILARCLWHPGGGALHEPKLFVYRDPDPLTAPLRLSGARAGEAATALLARKLGVADIDWAKQMLVCVTLGLGGQSLKVTRVEARDKVLTVFYRVEKGEGGAALGYAAETVLVERFDGEIRLQADP